MRSSNFPYCYREGGAPPVLVLDGGTGTTLEDDFKADISHPLWSSVLLRDNPEVITQAHEEFLRSGADMILTTTYQASFTGFSRAGLPPAQAVDLMRKAVQLSGLAVRRLSGSQSTLPVETPEGLSRGLIALSLGPYGAVLTPGQEYSGYYPPPYGPYPDLVPDSKLPGSNSSDDEFREALKDFHLERLKIFSEDEETWRKVDVIAFETIPLLVEAEAIRVAMTELRSRLCTLYGAAATLESRSETPIKDREELGEGSPSEWWDKPFFISYVMTDGRLPQSTHAGGDFIDVNVFARRTFHDDWMEPSSLSSASPLPPYARPFGIGINCTKLPYVSDLVAQISDALSPPSQNVPGTDRPWLVVYPDGGRTYDTATRTWTTPKDEEAHTKDRDDQRSEEDVWAGQLLKVVKEAAREKMPWGGFIVGGCCKTSPRHIRALRALCDAWIEENRKKHPQ